MAEAKRHQLAVQTQALEAMVVGSHFKAAY
jgi:hypothetical protein